MVIVNTVVLVQNQCGMSQRDTALALAAYGAGSMVVALACRACSTGCPTGRAMLAGVVILAPRPRGRHGCPNLRPAALILWLVLRAGLLAGADSIGTTTAPVGLAGGSPCRVLGPVRIVACLLAADLSAGGLARRDRRQSAN